MSQSPSWEKTECGWFFLNHKTTMLQKIHKKPLEHRKKILATLLIIAGISLIPVWFLGFKQTLNRKKSEPSKESRQTLEELKEIGENLRVAAEELKTTVKELNNASQGLEQSESVLPSAKQRLNGSSTAPSITQ